MYKLHELGFWFMIQIMIQIITDSILQQLIIANNNITVSAERNRHRLIFVVCGKATILAQCNSLNQLKKWMHVV